jgi:ABC-type glycerol-3-phosphate transport system substrate-binding protein
MASRIHRLQHVWNTGARLLWCYGLLLGMLTACMATSNPTTTSSPAPAPQITTLTIWHSWSGARHDALNALARNYEQANPSVRIRLEPHPAATLLRTFAARVADDSAPQILLTSGRYVGELAERQYVMPLDEAAFPLGSLLPAAVDSGRVNGALYAVPLTFDPLVLFYDRRTFATPPESFEELVNLQQTTPASDTAQWNLGYYLSLERTLPYLAAFGGTLFDADGQPIFANSSRDATIQWLRWLRELHTNPAVLAMPDFSTLDGEIQQERVLSVIDWAHTRADYEQLWGTDATGVAPLPSVRGGQPQTMILSEVACINAVTSPEQRAAAEAFLRFSLEPATQQLLAEQSRGLLLPTHGSATENAQEATLATQSAQAFTSQMAAQEDVLEEMVRSVVSNATDAAAAVDDAAAKAQAP